VFVTQISRRTVFAMGVGGSICLASRSLAAETIDESGFVSIGGIDQWVAIQGQHVRNPAILFLHGGPGEAQSPFLSQFKPWQHDYTVVNWDQRGAGKTYEKNGEATPDVRLDRLVDDAIALTEYLLKKLSKKKLVLVGQSAGTVLGLKVVQRRPDLFYAFVGTGQVVSIIRGAEWQEKQANVPATHDAAELRALHQWAILSPPDQPYMNLMREFMGPPEHPEPRAVTWLAGYKFESSRIGQEIESFDAMTSALDLAVPYVLVQGHEDRITPFAVAETYFDKVRSNGKAFVPINGGHYACFTNPVEFIGALNKQVRPLTI
jgi:pimeloyl-ACP methyl ester carboxylesterase